MPTREFVDIWDEQLAEEMDALEEEMEPELRVRIAGQWVSITEDQAIWRAPAVTQFPDKFPDWDWGVGSYKLLRPAELTYIRKKGKIILDGPKDVLEPLLRVLALCRTEPDDHPIMPIYDVTKMERYPGSCWGATN
ncbi:unnamed protein product [Effrenium voratum]|nr:unnamed protein product [Effrenium voratum]